MNYCSICNHAPEPGEQLYTCAECGADVCSTCSLNAGLHDVVCDDCLDHEYVWAQYGVVEGAEDNP